MPSRVMYGPILAGSLYLIAAIGIVLLFAPCAYAITESKTSEPALYDTTSSNYFHIAASAFSAFEITGNPQELQRSFVLPSPLKLDHIEFGYQWTDIHYLQIGLYTPFDRDRYYWLKQRDVEHGDVELTWLESSFYDRPNTEPAWRKQGDFLANFRGFKSPRGGVSYSYVREQGPGSLSDRDSSDTEFTLHLRAITPHFDAIASGSFGQFQDRLDGYNSMDRSRYDASIIRQLGKRAHIQCNLSHRELSQTMTNEGFTETEAELRGQLYSPFDVPNLRLQAAIRYMTRPDSFVDNSRLERRLDGNMEMLYLLDHGTFSAGMNRADQRVKRLNRQGIEQLLSNPESPLGILNSFYIYDYPLVTNSWSRLVLDPARYASFRFKFQDVAVDGQNGTDWVSPSEPNLPYTGREVTDIEFVLGPKNPVNLTLTRHTERRHWSDTERPQQGVTRQSHSSIICNVGCWRKVQLSLDMSDLDIASKDIETISSLTTEMLSSGFDCRFRVTPAFWLFMTQRNIATKGANELDERIVSYGIDYALPDSDTLSFSIAYGWDQLDDHSDSTNDFRARTLTVSTEARF